MRFFLALTLSLSVFGVGAEQYIVNQSTGNDGNPAGPFATIQKCADLASSGDTCYVEAGVYREEVRPNSGSNNQPLTFQAAPGESVRVTGLDVSTLTWTDEGGGIFSAPSVDPIYDVFLNDVLQTISMEPNFTDYQVQDFDIVATAECQKSDLSWTTTVGDCEKHPGEGSVLDHWVWRITSSDIDETLDWAGVASMGVLGYYEYSIQRGTILSSDADGVVFEWIGSVSDATSWPQVGSKFQITNTRAGVDADNEWAWVDGVIYYKPAGGSIPAGLEIKTRQLAFNLHARTGVVVDGFEVWAASVENNRFSEGNVINNIDASYVRSFGWFGGGQWPGQGTNRHNMLDGTGGFGITLAGRNNTLSNSTITHSWCDAVTMYGAGHTAINNTMTDINWGVTGCGAVVTGDYMTFTQNTVSDCTRGCISHYFLYDSIISYGDYSLACNVGLDCGVTYAYNWPAGAAPYTSDKNQDGVGTVMHHNWIHDARGNDSICLYLDNNMRDYWLHHNVVWNCVNGFVINDGAKSQGDQRIKVYNNTQFSVTHRTTNWGGSSDWQLMDADFVNNLSTSSYDQDYNGSTNPIATLSSNVGPDDPDVYGVAGANWADSALMLEDIDNNDFRPATGSPAINAGEVIRGITDDAVGAPDVGAYESGTGAAWVPGAQ